MSRTSSSVPVRGSDRVSDVLARDERLVEVFAGQSPRFENLRKPAMRRVMARLVTVEQAAKICGAEPSALLKAINDALGITDVPDAVPDAPAANGKSGTAAEAATDTSASAGAPKLPAGTRIVEVDVREDLRQGREPFSRIMGAVGALGTDEALSLRATFEPLPLFAVMKKRGFLHFSEQLGEEDWRVLFHRGGTAEEPAAGHADTAPSPNAGPVAEDVPAGDVVIDVRGLEPPEPMQRTLEALETLKPGGVLVQVNVRVPHFLLPILKERGFDYEIFQPNPDRVVVRIWHATSDATTAGSPVDGSPSSAANPTTPRTEAMSSTANPVELDVRPIPPRDKHPTIFRTFDGLGPGESMLLINDHDPAPLRYQMMAERGGKFEWTYLESGPQVWRVQIEHK